ncbi:MAG TPA: hypothetical protein VI485_07080 [Vicinamibacterales bacterium]|nr:hypothetical protein [Vicinamibacterales bacterium]
MTRALLVLAIVVCAPFGPWRAMAQTPVSPDGWVVLPVDEYRALRERANPQPPTPAQPPVDATLTRVDYDLRIENDAVAGRALLTIDVLRDGWVRVQIPAGLMVRDARLDGQPVSLVEGPPPHVLLSRTGRVVLTLDIALPLTSSAGTESIALPASGAPIARATLTLPRSGVDLSVAGGFVADRAESPGESRWTAYGRPNQPLTLSWKRKVDDRRAEQTLRTRARITAVVGLGEDVSQVAAAVRIEVLQGLAREVSLALPQGLVINQVNGATVGDWDVTNGILRVRLLDPVASEASFVVQGDMRTPREGVVAVPLLRVPSAERETGGVAVDVVGAGEIAERTTRGLEPADPSELGEIVAGRESPSMIAFRLRPLSGVEARSLAVTVVRYTPQAVLIANIEEARYRALASEDGGLLVEARYAVRNNQRSFLKVTMPAGSTVWSAKVGGRPIRPGVAERDAVLLPLEKGRAGEDAPTFVVDLVYLQRIENWVDKGLAHLSLPALDLPVSRTGVELHYSPRFRVALQPGSFRLEDDPGPFAEALRARAPVLLATARDNEQRAAAGLQALVDRFRTEAGGRTVAGALPVHVTFPLFGPSVFLASELTAESHAPSMEFAFKRR